MNAWWENLDLFQKIYWCIAIPSTVVLVIQSILIIFDFDDFDNDVDFDTDGLALFSIRGIVAFFTMLGWSGLFFYDISNKSLALSIPLSLICGFIALVVIAYIIKLLLKLQSVGNIDLKNAVGKTATVYLTIPKNESGTGKINLIHQERYLEVDALTSDDEDILTGSKVKIIGLENDCFKVTKNTKEKGD